jgi:energy-coupling factor transport system substrate-specific component
MTLEMDHFAYDSSVGRQTSIAQIKGLEVVTGNEIENLHSAIIKAVEEIDLYINKSEYQAASIAALQTNIITVLGDMVENRDETTGGHVRRTAAYAELIARELKDRGKEPEIDDAFISTIAVAAPLHDIGKINISDVILNKPGKLTDDEFAEMKKHTVYGRDMLVRASKNLGETAYLKMAKEIAYSHHEWWDGSRGYPERLNGKDIPLSARIMAVADVFDALVSRRSYKEPFSFEQACDIIREGAGSHFDPLVADAFLSAEEECRKVAESFGDTSVTGYVKDEHVDDSGKAR